MRRTKIVCTIGPASASRPMLEELARAGMDVARLNFSHGTQAEKGALIAVLRAVCADVGRPLAVLQDLAGPKVRTGPLPCGPVTLEAGRPFVLTGRDVPGSDREVSMTYPSLARDVDAGDQLLLSDGAIELAVERVEGADIHCRVVVGGPLGARKGINVPARSLRVPFPTEKDRSDLDFGLQQGVDYVALSFVRSAEDVHQVRRIVAQRQGPARLIAKIEKHEAIRNIDEIVSAADGLMIARGDLGVEIPIERIPRTQKALIQAANAAGKPVITATQMLKSMVESPRPTRAEVTDVANAVFDGTDALMLSEETAVGAYAVEAVAMMVRIAEEAEAGQPGISPSISAEPSAGAEHQEAVAHAACQLADDIRADAILTCTQSGSTARFVAKYRPGARILAATPDDVVFRQMALGWGVTPLRMPEAESQEHMETLAIEAAVRGGFLSTGQSAVITAGIPLHVAGTTNMIKVVTVP